jgi:RNA polymerase sigma-70 factor, ECF subfamily
MTQVLLRNPHCASPRPHPFPGPAPRDEIIHHLPSLRAFAISLTRNRATADDLVQDTFVKAWSRIDRFQRGTNLRAWLFTILRNTFYSDRRKLRPEVPDPDGLHAATLVTMPVHDGRLVFGDFRRAFGQLSAEHRDVLTLVGTLGHSCEEVAAMTGVAAGTVKSRTSRARRQLAALMGMTEGELVLSPSPGHGAPRQPVLQMASAGLKLRP